MRFEGDPEKYSGIDIKESDWKVEATPQPIIVTGIEGLSRKNLETISEALLRDPEAKLGSSEEIGSYLARQSPEYMRHIQSISAEMGPMAKECKVSVCIPAAGHEEAKNIYRTLLCYSEQKGINKGEYEINVLVNHPDRDSVGNEIIKDQTLEEVLRFKQEFPDINVRVYYAILPASEARISGVRKLLSDSVLYRQKQSGINNEDLIIVSNDADSVKISLIILQIL